MKHTDAFMIEIDIAQIVELLQNEMRGIIKQTGSRMVIHFFQESFISNTIMEIFAGMNFVAKVHTIFVKNIQDGFPSFSEFFKTCIYQASWSLWPGI